jgi:hypothetical protein
MKRRIQLGLVVMCLVAGVAGAQTLVAQGGPRNWGGPGGRPHRPASPEAVLQLSCRQLERMATELTRVETNSPTSATLPAGLNGFGADLQGVVTSHCPTATPAQ